MSKIQYILLTQVSNFSRICPYFVHLTAQRYAFLFKKQKIKIRKTVSYIEEAG